MLSVPWFVGWALRPYIQINGGTTTTTTTASSPTSAAASDADSTGSSVARAQVAKFSSAPTPSTVSSSKPYPVATQPIAAKPGSGGNQVRPQQPVQQIVSKSTVTKTAAAPPPTVQTGPTPPLVAKQAAAPAQSKPGSDGSGPAKQVSSTSITLKMSAEWASQQLEKFKFSFDEADRDKSGFLSLDEVVAVLGKNGFKGSKDDAKVSGGVASASAVRQRLQQFWGDVIDVYSPAYSREHLNFLV